MQSSHLSKLHVAIIMDGNGRWATARGLPRHKGHEAGVKVIRWVIEAAPEQGIGILTLYAFSSDNWQRPETEITSLMNLLRLYLRRETGRLARNGIRLSVIGRRDRLPNSLREAITHAETVTATGNGLHLRIAIDYSARDAILHAAAQLTNQDDLTREGFSRLVTGDPSVCDVDLLIRTSGEQRLSDFLLWESAYAELYFTPRLWPDFSATDLAEALADYHRRMRRFGGLNVPAAA